MDGDGLATENGEVVEVHAPASDPEDVCHPDRCLLEPQPPCVSANNSRLILPFPAQESSEDPLARYFAGMNDEDDDDSDDEGDEDYEYVL